MLTNALTRQGSNKKIAVKKLMPLKCVMQWQKLQKPAAPQFNANVSYLQPVHSAVRYIECSFSKLRIYSYANACTLECRRRISSVQCIINSVHVKSLPNFQLIQLFIKQRSVTNLSSSNVSCHLMATLHSDSSIKSTKRQCVLKRQL